MVISSRRYRVVAWCGIAAMFTAIVLGGAVEASESTQRLLTGAPPMVFLVVLLLFWSVKLGVKPKATPPPTGTGSPAPTLLRNQPELLRALAARTGDPDAMASVQPGGSLYRGWLVVLWAAMLLPAEGFYFYVAHPDGVPGWASPLMTVSVFAVAALGISFLVFKVLRDPGDERPEDHLAAGLGLRCLERSRLDFTPMLLRPGHLGPRSRGRTVLEGERLGRQVRIAFDEADSEVQVAAGVPPFELTPDRRGNLQPDATTPTPLVAALESLHPYNVWSSVTVRGGPSGLVVARSSNGMVRVPSDLWLAEWILDVLGAGASPAAGRQEAASGSG